jgi:hypothetical protein
MNRHGRFVALAVLMPVAAWSQAGLGSPTIAAAAKGPNQINLAWSAVSNPGYGYLVEIQSGSDSRYSSWQELWPIPQAGGYVCDNTVAIRGAYCNISDPSGTHVYNSPNNGIPYWVTEANYTDPRDGSPAQFIAAGLKPNTSYSFRVRTYSGITSPAFGAYSNVANAATSNYVRGQQRGGIGQSRGKGGHHFHLHRSHRAFGWRLSHG